MRFVNVENFLQMAYQLHGMLAGNVSVVAAENIKPAYGGDEEFFLRKIIIPLRKIIIPLYRIVEEESKKNRNGTAPHSSWCNYDDLNEYLWSIDCFYLGWPMRDDSDFFRTSGNPRSLTHFQKASIKLTVKGTGKTNFVEIHTSFEVLIECGHSTFFHCRKWLLLLGMDLVLQWIFFRRTFLSMALSIFITAAILCLIQGVLDIILNFKAYHSMRLFDMYSQEYTSEVGCMRVNSPS